MQGKHNIENKKQKKHFSDLCTASKGFLNQIWNAKVRTVRWVTYSHRPRSSPLLPWRWRRATGKQKAGITYFCLITAIQRLDNDASRKRWLTVFCWSVGCFFLSARQRKGEIGKTRGNRALWGPVWLIIHIMPNCNLYYLHTDIIERVRF